MSEEQQLIQKMIEDLVRVATRYKVVVAGYAFSAEPSMLMNFGNCKDCGELRLYELLTKTYAEKSKTNSVQKTTVGEVN